MIQNKDPLNLTVVWWRFVRCWASKQNKWTRSNRVL